MLIIIVLVTLIITCYKLLHKIKSSRLQAYLEEGDKLYKDGHLSEALVFYKNVIKISNTAFSAYLKMIKTYVWQGDFDEALSASDAFIEKFPDTHIPYYIKGGAYEYYGKIEKALECYNHAFEIEPHNKNLCFSRAVVIFLLNRYEESIIQFDTAIILGYDQKNIYYFIGEALINLHKYYEAEEHYKSAIELYPNDSYLNGKIACVKFYQGNYKASKEIYDKLEEQYNKENGKLLINPLIVENSDHIKEFLSLNNVEYNELVNNNLINTEKTEDVLYAVALKIASVARDKESSDEEAFNWAIDRWKEIISFNLNYNQSTSSIYKKSTSLYLADGEKYSEDEHCNYMIDTIYDEKVILKRAKPRVFRKYLKNGICFILLLSVIVYAYSYMYKYSQDTTDSYINNTYDKEAINKLVQAFKYNEDGKMMLRLSYYKDALELFDQSITLYPNYAELHVNKAKALIHLNEYNKAIDESSIALDINKDDEEALMCKGDALALLNRYQEAINTYERVLKINPQNTDAADKKEKYEKLIN